jgi:hypothetical protein
VLRAKRGLEFLRSQFSDRLLDEDMNAIMAPSWEHLDDALVAASSVLRFVSYYDEMAQLGMQERIRSGPNEAYVAACKSLP